MTPLPGDMKPHILLIGADPSLRDVVVSILEELDAEAACQSSIGSGDPSKPWDAVILIGNQFAPTDTAPQTILGTWEAARSLTFGEVLWVVTARDRGAEARALTLGADGILAGVGSPLFRARLRTHVALAKSRNRLAMAEQERNEEKEGLSALLSVHEAVGGLSFSSETGRLFRDALHRLFPLADVDVRVFEESRDLPVSAARRIDVDALGRWREALIPLSMGERTLGLLRVSAPPNESYSRNRLDYLELFALHAAQASHRNLLYRALSIGKAEWEETFDTISDCISMVGPDYSIRRANLALANLVGKEPRDLIGIPCYQALRGSPEPCSPCPVTRVFAAGEPSRMEGQCFDTDRIFDHQAYPLRDADGRVRGAISYGRDTTREEELRKSLAQSEKLMTVGQIAAGIAHEINNPLTAISSYAQLLSMRLTDPKAVESARRIEEGISRIHLLVQNLTSFVRPSEDTFYPLDLNEIVADTLSFSRYDLTRGETKLSQELASSLPKVLGAKDQLEQVLVSLLTNARDALGGRGTITVRTYAQNGNTAIQVEDDGVGIRPEEFARLFEPFYTTKPAGKGTGLGLFIAAGIAKKHRGEILVESGPGRGSTFTLSLPTFRA